MMQKGFKLVVIGVIHAVAVLLLAPAVYMGVIATIENDVFFDHPPPQIWQMPVEGVVIGVVGAILLYPFLICLVIAASFIYWRLWERIKIPHYLACWIVTGTVIGALCLGIVGLKPSPFSLLIAGVASGLSTALFIRAASLRLVSANNSPDE